MQVLRGLAHDQGRLVDDLLGDDPGVGIDALAHGVASHVLDATGDGDVNRAERDRGRGGRHRSHRPGAHPVNGVARRGVGQAGEQRSQATQGQALVADLRGGRDGNFLDPRGGQLRVAAQKLLDALDDQIIGAGLGIDALLPGLAEWGPDTVNEDDVMEGTGHGRPPVRSRWG